MSGRVTRRSNRRRNIETSTVHQWFIQGSRQPGECEHAEHAKEFGRLLAEFRLFGPWDGSRLLPGCGCSFVSIPLCSL